MKKRPATKNDSIEVLRILSALGVMWFHIHGLPGKKFAYTGLIAFTILTAFFSRHKPEGQNLGVSVCKRALRLLLPWAFWFIAYAVAKAVMDPPLNPYQQNWISWILTGPWVGLWYLPFAALASTIPLIASLRKTTPFALAGYLVATVLSFFAATEIRETFYTVPWAQWVHAAPAILVGIVFRKASEQAAPLRSIQVSAAIMTLAAIVQTKDLGFAIPYAISIPLIALTLCKPLSLHRSVAYCSSLCLGAYLIHGALISLALKIPILSSSLYSLFAFVSLAAFLATAALQRIKPMRPFL